MLAQHLALNIPHAARQRAVAIWWLCAKFCHQNSVQACVAACRECVFTKLLYTNATFLGKIFNFIYISLKMNVASLTSLEWEPLTRLKLFGDSTPGVFLSRAFAGSEQGATAALPQL